MAIRPSRDDWGLFVELHASVVDETNLRLAVLDAPPVFTPVMALDLEGRSLADWGRDRGLPPATAFEHAALRHARALIPALDDLSLCEDNALSIDFHTPDRQVLVGQVKSGRTAQKPAIDQALGAATLPGRDAGRQHLFFYSEGGYKSGTYEFADERGIFLWHLDFEGRVLPWSASARWLVARTEELRHASPDKAKEVLDQCAWREASDRVAARSWIVDEVEGLWEANFGQVRKDSRPWRHYVSWAVQAAEQLQSARSAVREMFRQYLSASRRILSQFDRAWPPTDLVTPNHLLWRNPAFVAQRHQQAYRLCWLANGAGAVTEESINWPVLPEAQMDVLFAWNDNCWDGDSEFHLAREEELLGLNRHRRETVKSILNGLIRDYKRRGFLEHAAALQSLRGGRWECTKCVRTSGYLSDLEDFGSAPHLVEAERVWAAMLRGEKVPPQMYEGFSDGDENSHLWWGGR